MQFQAHDSYWSHYCGIVCLSPSLILSNPIWGPDRRILTVTVSHIHDSFEPITVSALYVPANAAERQTYLDTSILL
jgi:hypothetical protein